MINVKLVVLFIFIIIGKCLGRYCEICSNHTLCKFPRPGPSTNCKGYNKTAHLTKNDVTNIVNRINERRNSIALGLSNLPPAANMMKIEWSETLAMFAQRWVDQCHPSVHPDKEDHCRDLDDTPVGQNVATITGPSPGLQVKSFIDVWFMQILDYKGGISYYNQSRSAKTNYFTQLIWAQTDTVGCGKAKFFIHNGNTMTERLVCNFAPKGNIHGKTVYAIGIAATQCPDNSTPDTKFSGLCRYKIQGSGIFTFKPPPVSSSLRILNLANNSVKQDIDPIRNNLKLMKFSDNQTDNQRNQKIRHVIMNNTHAGIPHDPSQQMHWKHPINISKSPGFRRYEQVERGHSRVYHGHDHKDNSVPQYQENVDDNFRRYDFTTQTLLSYPSSNFRKHYQQCTRKLTANGDCVSSAMSELVEQCTKRSISDCCLLTLPWQQPTVPDLCSCSIHRSTCPPSTTQCNCKINCHCPSVNSESIDCPQLARRQEKAIKDKAKIPSEFHYYDLLPNIAIRSGNTVNDKQSSGGTTTSINNLWLLKSTVIDHKHLKTMSHKRREYQKNNRQEIDAPKYPKYIDQEQDYLYDSFDSSERQRREPEEQMTLKPFWQMDEYVYKQPSQLKAMRYTTFANKRNRKSKTLNIVTEPITIRFNPNIRNDHDGHITEKYLSFDELMHLRKFNAEDYDARRANSATTKKAAATKKASTATKSAATTKKTVATIKSGATTKAPATTKVANTLSTTKILKGAIEEYTINTPFERKKHCTRKLTCTWTLPTITANDGSVIDPNKRGGSRTPPGYVEGCTRTSTCTRDFLNRNRVSLATHVPESENISDTDEDYCERRSLNVRRRNSDEEYLSVHNTGYHKTYTDTPTTMSVSHNSEVVSYKDDTFLDDCVCHEENSRKKRDSKEYDEKYFVPNCVNSHYKKKMASSQYSVSYGDLYYLVLKKIIKTWNDNKNSLQSGGCPCNKSVVVKKNTVLIIFSILYKIAMN